MLQFFTSLPSHYYFIAIFAFVVGWWLIMRVRRTAGIWKLRYFALPRPWLLFLHKHVPLYRRVPVELRAPYQDKVLHFVDGKNFRWADPMKLVEEDVRVTLAGTGCLLLLNSSGDGSFPDLLAVQLWPEGTTMEEIEASPSRPVKSIPLIWDTANHRALDPRDARDRAALEKAATALGWASGGQCELPDALVLAPWSRLRAASFAARHGAVLAEIPGDPEVVFAAATEMFYHAPERLQKVHPKIYGVLRSFYCVDPARWRSRA